MGNNKTNVAEVRILRWMHGVARNDAARNFLRKTKSRCGFNRKENQGMPHLVETKLTIMMTQNKIGIKVAHKGCKWATLVQVHHI